MAQSPRLVVAVSTTALFDLSVEDEIFRTAGERAFIRHQEEHEFDILAPGPAYPFVRRLLGLNAIFGNEQIDVVLLSRNDCSSGMRVVTSIEYYGLSISRRIFTSGRPPWPYAGALRAQLYLSSNEQDVRMAIDNGLPAGWMPRQSVTDDGDNELRIAFDFDGVIGDDSSDRVFKEKGLEQYRQHEAERASELIGAGPLSVFLEMISSLQRRERIQKSKHPDYQPRIRTALITARDGPTARRAVYYLRSRKIVIDEVMFLGGLDKTDFLNVFRPHLFFEDNLTAVKDALGWVPAVHIPFGFRNVLKDDGAATEEG